MFLFVRTIAVEPFGVPTGSMAPALIGNHRQADCPRCGYPVVVGEPTFESQSAEYDQCRCPNCDDFVDLSHAEMISGDRLLVDKTAFLDRRPHRWEIAVFQCPVDSSKPYVKRTIGLPGEQLHIHDGDVYANGKLLRKTLADVRETCIPVLDMNYVPKPHGWSLRWLVEDVTNAPKLPPTGRTKAQPADEAVLPDHDLHLDATGQMGIGVTYRHWNFDLKGEEPISLDTVYNGPEPFNDFATSEEPAAHDLLLTFDLVVHSGSDSFACRLGDGADWVTAEFPIGFNPAAHVRVTPTGRTAPATATGLRLKEGRTYHIEFAFVDRRVSLAIDGREVIPAIDLPEIRFRKRLSRPIQFGVRNASVVVQNLRIDRDIHYHPGSLGSNAKWQLGPSEYFMLGDNTLNSQDSREWKRGEVRVPGVPESGFLGKPMLIHQPMRLERLPLPGRLRTVQFIDWPRLRWLK